MVELFNDGISISRTHPSHNYHSSSKPHKFSILLLLFNLKQQIIVAVSSSTATTPQFYADVGLPAIIFFIIVISCQIVPVSLLAMT
jgi:hypothetical protein